LLEAGFPIDTQNTNGEVRYRLLGEPMPPVQPTARQALALRLARSVLAPLQGSKILRELDALLPRPRPIEERSPKVGIVVPRVVGEPSIVAALEKAMGAGLRLAFTYAASQGAPKQRKVDPLALHVVEGQLYLDAFDVDKAAVRTFKAARIKAIHVLDEKAAPHDDHEEARVFAHAAKIWDGPLVDVAVRISPRGARFVNEWPLVPSQQIDEQADGSVIVRARVSGTVETMRWVLRWGKEAQVLAPEDLRAAVLTELLRSIAAYAGQPVSDS
jgi:predicted DNA-binding transcriptional regulator YafY